MADEKQTPESTDEKVEAPAGVNVPTADNAQKRPLQETVSAEDRSGRSVIVNLPYGSEPVSTGDDRNAAFTGNAEGVEVTDGESADRPKANKTTTSRKSSSK